MYVSGELVTLSNYDQLIDKMSNMDLIMFRGDDIISDTIADLQIQEKIISLNNGLFTVKDPSNGDIINFTHAGLIVKADILPEYNLDPTKLYILESTYSHEISGMNNGPPDYLTNKQYFGVQLRELEQVCRSYIQNDKTKISWVKLKFKPNLNNFSLIFKKYHMRPFMSDNSSLISKMIVTPDLLRSAKSFIDKSPKDKSFISSMMKSSFSCVNLITSVYYDVGLISGNELIMYPMELLKLNRIMDKRRVIYREDN